MQHKHIKCPQCGNFTQADFPYCNYCGAELDNTAIQTEETVEKEIQLPAPNCDTATPSYIESPTNQKSSKVILRNEKTHMKNKFLSIGFTIMMIIGIALFIYGCTIKIPSEKLSYFSYDKDTSQIDKYVGGDAYNYIIGAEIVGSKIVAAKTERAIFICVGLFMATLGGAIVAYVERKHAKDKSEKTDGTVNTP